MIRTTLIRKLKVLIVDDNEMHRRILERILMTLFKGQEAFRLFTLKAESGEEAIEKFKYAMKVEYEPFDLVILDNNMKTKVLGIEVAHQIRNMKFNGYLANKSVILGCSSDFLEPESGLDLTCFDDCLPKAITSAILREALFKHLSIELPDVLVKEKDLQLDSSTPEFRKRRDF